MTTRPPLQSRVLDLSRGVAGHFATVLLAGLGAQCSRWRWSTDTPGDWPDDPLFRRYFDLDIDSVARETPLDAMLAMAERLAPAFDLVVTDFNAREVAQDALYARLRPANPAIVVANADHFGRSGPYAGWHGDELTDYAMGGYWAIAGDPDRAPLRVPGYQAGFHAGMQLTIAALAALRHARLTGEGQEVETTGAEAMLGAHWSTTVAWTHEGRVFERTGPDLFRARDGWVFFYRIAMYPQVFALIGREELRDDPRWDKPRGWFAHAAEIWAMVEAWCADEDVDSIVERAQALRIPATPMGTATSLLADPVLAERGFFREDGGVRYPGLPYRWPEDWGERRPVERLAALLNAPPAPLPTAPLAPAAGARPPASGLPLRGIRVLELTNNWAGPIAGRHLADLGADVIKVEFPSKPATRASHWPAREPGKYFWNRSGYFNEMNRNKRSLALDIAKPEGRELFLDLVHHADVVVENNSARVMPKLGVGYETLREVQPRLVMVSISGFGATGPRRDWIAYGSNIEAACGLASMTGYDGEVPYRTGTFVADPIAGANAAIAAIAALERRDRTGEGAHVDIALTETAMPFFLLAFTHLQHTGQPFAPCGSADPWDAPTGAYRCGGKDDWVAVAVRTDAQWAALAALAGIDPVPGRTRADRVANREAIDDALNAWTADLAQYECVRALQAVGVPSAPILRNFQFHSDPHFFARDAFIHIEHPDTGVMPYPGFPWHFSATVPGVRMAAPRFAEGNAYVFRQLLGLDDAAIARLYESGATSDAPVGLAAPLVR